MGLALHGGRTDHAGGRRVAAFLVESVSSLTPRRTRARRLVDSRWMGTMLAAIPSSAIVLTFVADGLGLFDLDRTWLAGLALLLGSAAVVVDDAVGAAPRSGLPWPGPGRGGHARSRLVRGRVERRGLAGRMARDHSAMPGPGALGGWNRDAADQALGFLYRAVLPHGLLAR